jgi:histidinol phosphatase-like enzyme
VATIQEIATDRGLADSDSTTIFLDLDTVLLTTHQGKYGPELGLQADIIEAIDRMAEFADNIVVAVDPAPREHARGMDTAHRVELLRAGLGGTSDLLTIATCPHGESGDCDCAKPGSGLIDRTLAEKGLRHRGGWYVTADQEGVVAGRGAGLKTVRIGPVGEDHLSAVHRADYEARDLLDAANRIMLEVLAA